MLFSSQSMPNKQKCAILSPAEFYGFGSEHVVPIDYTRFLKLAHLMQMSRDGGMVTET